MVLVRVLRRLAAWALPRPSATDSATFANSTVSHSQTAMPQVNGRGHGGAAGLARAAEERLGDREHGRERRADPDQQHDGVAHERRGVELAQGAGQRLRELAAPEGARLRGGESSRARLTAGVGGQW